MTLKFRCPAELEGLLPPPVPAASGLPDWLKSMPAQAFNTIMGGEDNTVKRCPPFVDAMTSGFLIPLMCDLRVEDGEITWDNDFPQANTVFFARSPVGVHDAGQVSGTPLFDTLNRFDLPFTTLTGIVDCDRYYDNWVHFPAHWHDTNFSGVLPKGTPIAQCLPVKRERWTVQCAPFTEEEALRVRDLAASIEREQGVYRRKFRA
jgi:hypothetical protein